VQQNIMVFQQNKAIQMGNGVLVNALRKAMVLEKI
jgi:hypothetical protein